MLEGGGVVSIVGAGGKTSLMFRIELIEAGESVLTTTTTKIEMPTKDQSPHVIRTASLEEILRKAKALRKNSLHISAVSKHDYFKMKLIGFKPEFIDDIWGTVLFNWILVEADGASRRPLKAPSSHEPVIPKSTRWLIAVAGVDSVGKHLDERWVFRPEIYADITGLSLGESVNASSIATAVMHERGVMKGCPPEAMRFAFINKADIQGGLEAGREIVGYLKKTKGNLTRAAIGTALHEPPVMEYYDM
jgi:probable selenium-dependent hydroxylase accessory protein YqeC